MSNTSDKEWSGYTLDELRFRRMLTTTKIGLEKNMLASSTRNLTRARQEQGSIMTRMFSALDYIDYGVIAYRLGRRLFSLFRRKK